MGLSLLEISDQYLGFRAALESSVDEHGELQPDDAARLDAWFANLTDQRDAKLDAMLAWVEELKLRAAVRKEAEERLAKRWRVDDNLQRSLKDRVKLFMEQQGLRSVETDRYRVSVCNNGGKPPIEVACHAAVLPERYQRCEYKPNEETIRADLEAGVLVPGCRLLPRGNHLRVS